MEAHLPQTLAESMTGSSESPVGLFNRSYGCSVSDARTGTGAVVFDASAGIEGH